MDDLTPDWRAFITAVIYFGTFLTLGTIAKRILDGWMARRGDDIAEVQRQAGPNRPPRRMFLLGAWRTEE